jgi:aminopeptidase N
MITFAGGRIDTDTLYHENMHQWWGDHVTEADYHLTFFKEGLATLGEFLFQARKAAAKHGGLSTPDGRRAFEDALTSFFNEFYSTTGKNFWRHAPSDPTPYLLFSGNSTYLRPGISYIALRKILGPDRFSQALAQMQQQYGGGSITEGQLESGFAQWLPNPSTACRTRLTAFFRQWWDTAYPPGGGRNRPQITGPGLAGPNFYGARGCTR